MSRPDEWLVAGLLFAGFVLVLVVGERICPSPGRRGWRK